MYSQRTPARARTIPPSLPPSQTMPRAALQPGNQEMNSLLALRRGPGAEGAISAGLGDPESYGVTGFLAGLGG